MRYNPEVHRRRSIRLKNYDYSAKALFFVTICVQDRKCIFGKIVHGKMCLNAVGRMIEEEWLKLQERFPNILMHNFVVMPNHFHAILEIVSSTDKTLGDIIKAFKSITTVRYIQGVKKYGWPRYRKRLWQRNYWEYIIRNERIYHKISDYIDRNPQKWYDDRFFPNPP